MTGKTAPKAPRRHHYVPRLLLRRFARERKLGKYQTNILDKLTGHEFIVSVEDAMVASDFNAVSIGDQTHSLEEWLSGVENLVGPIISKIVEQRALGGLLPRDFDILAFFAAVQMLRTTTFRAQIADIRAKMRNRLIEFAEGRPIDPEVEKEATEADIKLMAMQFLGRDVRSFAELIRRKDILLFSASEDAEFLVGDCPLALHNDKQFGAYGNLGLAVPGIQIYLPVSPQLQLGFWCPSLLDEMRTRTAKASELVGFYRSRQVLGLAGVDHTLAPQIEHWAARIPRHKAFIRNAETGDPIESDPPNVEFLNWLQVSFAERFIASISGDFALARKIIRERPEAKRGRRASFN